MATTTLSWMKKIILVLDEVEFELELCEIREGDHFDLDNDEPCKIVCQTKRPQANDRLAKLMALAFLSGDTTAALALADKLVEERKSNY
jgi:hypothetical protein